MLMELPECPRSFPEGGAPSRRESLRGAARGFVFLIRFLSRAVWATEEYKPGEWHPHIGLGRRLLRVICRSHLAHLHIGLDQRNAPPTPSRQIEFICEPACGVWKLGQHETTAYPILDDIHNIRQCPKNKNACLRNTITLLTEHRP